MLKVRLISKQTHFPNLLLQTTFYQITYVVFYDVCSKQKKSCIDHSTSRIVLHQFNVPQTDTLYGFFNWNLEDTALKVPRGINW